jgi:hypothetical protein
MQTTAITALQSATASSKTPDLPFLAAAGADTQAIVTTQADAAIQANSTFSSTEPPSPPTASSSTGVMTSIATDCGSSTTVFAVSTHALATKKPRKVRSDKGKPRGSNGKKKALGKGAETAGVQAAEEDTRAFDEQA